MIDSIVQWNVKNPDKYIVISVELENRSEKNLILVKDADYVFLSKDFAELMGWSSKEVAIHSLRKYVKKEYVLLSNLLSRFRCNTQFFNFFCHFTRFIGFITSLKHLNVNLFCNNFVNFMFLFCVCLIFKKNEGQNWCVHGELKVP